MRICGGLIMPAAKNIEEKYIQGIKVDKENDSVFFNDSTHTYYDKETLQKYISVTQLVSTYSQEFDEEFWSAYKALEQLMDGDKWSILKPILLNTKKFKIEQLSKCGVDKETFLNLQSEIKAEYKRKRDESCARGTTIHEQFELGFYGKKQFDFSRYNLPALCGNFDCKQNYYKLDLQRGVYPELLLSCKFDNVLVSGQIDLCIIDGTDVYIIDHKTNAEIKMHSYFDTKRKTRVMMKAPLNDVEDCSWGHYCLQLSLYAYMIETLYPNLTIKALKINHIDHNDKVTILDVPYLKEAVKRMLKDYSRKLRTKEQLDRIEPYKIG